MLNLLDGPCEGVYYCKRAPVFLRAVINQETDWKDCLDQVEDTPKDLEIIYVYKLEGEPGWIHIHGSKIHGFYASGNYHFMPELDGEKLRDNLAWQEWASKEFERV